MSGEAKYGMDVQAATGSSYYVIVKEWIQTILVFAALLVVGYQIYLWWRGKQDNDQKTSTQYKTQPGSCDEKKQPEHPGKRAEPEPAQMSSAQNPETQTPAAGSRTILGYAKDVLLTKVQGVKMVQITEFVKNEQTNRVMPVFHAYKVAGILAKRDCRDLPFLVISIIGPKRSGKSFLTNILVSFLRYLETDPNDMHQSGWLRTNALITGVDWQQERKAVTKGIWMWYRPFIVKRGASKMAVLLMDCQGLYDADDVNEKAVDTLVTLFALKISKIHIVNMKGDVRSNDLEHLEVCLTFSNISMLEKKIKQLFDTLVIVHRDWQEDGELGTREKDFFTELAERRDGNLKKSEHLLRDAFRKCIEFMAPRPGKNVTHASSGGALRMEDFMAVPESSEFFVWMNKLCLLLFDELPKDGARLTKRSDLMAEVQRLSQHYADGDHLVDFGSPTDVLKYNSIMGILDEVKSRYQQHIDGIDVKKVKSAKELEILLREIHNQVAQYLLSSKNAMSLVAHGTEGLWGDLQQKVDRWLEERMKAKRADCQTYAAAAYNCNWKTGLGIGVATALVVATGGLATPVVVGAGLTSGVGTFLSGIGSWLFTKPTKLKKD